MKALSDDERDQNLIFKVHADWNESNSEDADNLENNFAKPTNKSHLTIN